MRELKKITEGNMRLHSFFCDDETWSLIKDKSSYLNISASEYLRTVARRDINKDIKITSLNERFLQNKGEK